MLRKILKNNIKFYDRHFEIVLVKGIDIICNI